MQLSLMGRVALVTGGGRGIGAAIARRFAEAGAAVVIANRTLDVARALAAELVLKGQRATAIEYPGSTRADLAGLVERAAGYFPGLDIVVHNAGGCPWASIAEMTEDQLEQALAVNLSACFWLAQAALPHLKGKGHGRILVTSSISARVAMAGGAHYSAAKAGVNAFIRGAAFEFARDGITVNGVEPGFIAKPGRGTLSTPEKQAAISRYIPQGHIGKADDVAAAMLYLASDAAKYMTGQTLVVDGGATLPETGYAVEDYWG